jgi:hypothetical protein
VQSPPSQLSAFAAAKVLGQRKDAKRCRVFKDFLCVFAPLRETASRMKLVVVHKPGRVRESEISPTNFG